MSVKTANPVDVHIGARIRAERQARGISQTALGRGIGVTFQQVQKYEKGGNRVGGSRLVKIADILGVQVAAFMPSAEVAIDPAINLALQVLTLPGGRELLLAYATLGSREDRNALVHIAKVMAARPVYEDGDVVDQSAGHGPS